MKSASSSKGRPIQVIDAGIDGRLTDDSSTCH